MPTHIHANDFNATFDYERLKRTLTDFRTYTRRSLIDFCGIQMPTYFANALRASSTADREWRFWQPSRHPIALQTEPFWKQKLHYLHENPCRNGLVTRAADRRFSSVAYCVSDGADSCDVRISGIDWTYAEWETFGRLCGRVGRPAHNRDSPTTVTRLQPSLARNRDPTTAVTCPQP